VNIFKLLLLVHLFSYCYDQLSELFLWTDQLHWFIGKQTFIFMCVIFSLICCIIYCLHICIHVGLAFGL